MIHYGWLILLVLTGGSIALRRWLRTTAGKLWWHRMQLRLPVIRNITKANAFAHFARTLETLIRNGVPILSALSIVQETLGNQVLANEISAAHDRVTDGSSISGPLAESHVFPEVLTDMLAVGEETGDLTGSLQHIARRYDEQLDQNIKVLTTVLEPILILGVALIVGFVAISMLLAVFDLTSGLSA
jgi:type II secretory pathway component PulF